jgi:hypothetical protein
MTLDEKNGWKEVPCPSCGKTVVWADITKADGKPGRVPLDPKPPVYLVTKDDQAVRADQKREHEARYMVSHFATCKNPPSRVRR